MVLGDTNIPRAWKTMENSDMNEWWEGQCNRNVSQTESLCIHLFQSTEVPFCLILQQIRAEIHLIWQWKRLNVNLSNHSDSDEWWSTKRPQSPRHQTGARTAATLPQTCSSQMRSVICRHRVENTWEILGISYKTIISGCWFQQSIRNYEHHWLSLRIIIQSDWNMLLNSCRTYHL